MDSLGQWQLDLPEGFDGPEEDQEVGYYVQGADRGEQGVAIKAFFVEDGRVPDGSHRP